MEWGKWGQQKTENKPASSADGNKALAETTNT